MPSAVGRYEIRRELGRGAMGVVFEAYDPDLGRTIALKTLLPVPKEEREAFEQRFFAEARAARLAHPGIVIVHDVGRDAATGTLFLALEFLEGRTLSEVASAGPLDWREAFRIGTQVARALQYAHSQGIVHRDMKPANVMVLPSGQTKIMDFGIAGGMVDTARFKKLTSPGEFLGTPLYAAPEQATDQKLDGRADVFSLGSILYTLIAGEPAFAADSIPEIVGRVVNDDPVPLTRIVRGLPVDADRVVSRAMAKDRGDRYPDAQSFADDLEDVREGRPPRHSTEETRLLAASAHALPSTWPAREVELVVAEDPLESALHALVSDVPHPEATAPTAVRGSTPPVPLEAHDGDRRPRDSRSWASWSATSGSGERKPQLHSPSSPRPRPPPPRRSRRIPSRRPPPPPSTSHPPPPPRIAPAVGRLRIVFDHPLKAGALKVWVDDELVIEEKLTSIIEKKALVFRMRKGTFTDVLEVKPGWHQLRVEVAWEDNKKTQKIMGRFRGGSTRILDVSLGRLLKDLDLEWRK